MQQQRSEYSPPKHAAVHSVAAQKDDTTAAAKTVEASGVARDDIKASGLGGSFQVCTKVLHGSHHACNLRHCC